MCNIVAARGARSVAVVLIAVSTACHSPSGTKGGGGAETSLAGKLVFARSSLSGTGIVQVDPDGSSPRLLTLSQIFVIPVGAAVSPDGRHLAREDQLSDRTRIVLEDLSTGDTLLFPADQSRGYGAPSWSPSGSEIAFQDGTHGSLVIPPPPTEFGRVLVANADGSGARVVGDSAILGSAVTWSREGTHVLYSRVGVLVSVMADGSTPVPVPIGSADSVLDPAMSPDGVHIAFANGWPGPTAIFVMNADGSSPVQVTTQANADRHPAWSPDGTLLAMERDGFVSDSILSAIVVMGVAGTDPRVVSPGGLLVFDQWPSWGPAAR